MADELIPKADGIRTVSKRIKDSLVTRYKDALPETSVLPIPPKIELPSKEDLPAHTFSFALVALSRFEEEKRIEDIFHALFRVQRRYPNTGLFLIGGGRMEKELKEKARHCCRPHSVIFLPWRDDALALLQSANAFIQASAYEGYGRTLIEAALAKVPIITTDVGVVGEVLKPGEDALVSPVGDIEALANNIQLAIEDERLRLMLPLSARDTAREHIALYENQPKRIAEDLARVLKKA
jgi:glycosyltransferase involved in cell wall biosynthesis